MGTSLNFPSSQNHKPATYCFRVGKTGRNILPLTSVSQLIQGKSQKKKALVALDL